MRKIQIIIDVEVNDEGLTEQAIERAWGEYTDYPELLSDPENQADIRRQRTFVNHILNTPALMNAYMRGVAVAAVAELDDEELKAYTGVGSHMNDLHNTLRKATDDLSDMDKHYFQSYDADHPLNANMDSYPEAVRLGAEFMRKTDLVAASFDAQIKSITVVDSE